MKILLLADPSSIHVIKWANSLSKKGIKLSLFGFSSFEKSVYDSNISINSLNIESYKITNSNTNFHKTKYLMSIIHLKKVLKSFKPDLVHAHYASSYGLIGRIIDFHPYFISVWGSDVFEFPKRSFLSKRVLNIVSMEQIKYFQLVE